MQKWVGWIFFGVFSAFAQQADYFEAEPIVVTAGRFPMRLAEISRSVTVLDSTQVRLAAHLSVQELLQQAVGVDLQSRGPAGIQADVSIRGASFENTVVLLDGIRLNDPQTAHHTLNLPVSLDDVERIEVVRGGASGWYGADAAGGVINIITRNAGSNVRLSGGQAGFYGVAASAGFTSSRHQTRFSFERRHSDGYAPRTAYDLTTLFLRSRLSLPFAALDLYAGVNDKAFDANAFYSSLYPDEWEHTRAWLGAGRLTWRKKNVQLSPLLAYRRHFDDFVLDKARPDWYRNRHTNHTLSVEWPLHLLTPYGRFSFTAEWRREWIRSSNLGEHARETLGAVAGWQRVFAGQWDVQAALYGHHHSRWGTRLWPGAEIGRRFGNHKLYAALHSAFRVPSFTELYYQSPANLGNPALQCERSVSGEIGWTVQRGPMQAGAAVFQRRGRDLIDWVRNDVKEPWRAVNLGKQVSTGIEFQAETAVRGVPSLSRMALHYSEQQSSKDTPAFQSKYVLRYLRRQAGVRLTQALSRKVELQWSIQYKQRRNEPAYTLLDATLCW
ncbi:MAG: TonB-dependent receptor, partial [candidate division KSB1 bacterium]|nr:TonB-dependent receptor [candidate division KSB1 bacterium]